MRIQKLGDTVKVSEIIELATAGADAFRSELNAALPSDATRIDIDLSQTRFVDCGGLGALVAVRRCARARGGDVTVRLLNPPHLLQRLLEITRLDGTFQMVPSHLPLSASPAQRTEGPFAAPEMPALAAQS